MRRSFGLSGLGGAGFGLEAVKPELGIERWDWYLDCFKGLDAERPVSASTAGRRLPQGQHSFFAKEPEAQEFRGRSARVRYASQEPVRADPARVFVGCHSNRAPRSIAPGDAQ